MDIGRIINGTVFTEQHGFIPADLTLRDGRIAEIIPRAQEGQQAAGCSTGSNGEASGSDGEVIDAAGRKILPGLVDIHFHGCSGHDFCEGTDEAFRAIESYETAHGITSICPATMTYPLEKLEKILTAADAYRNAAGAVSALQGVNLEGPFLSYEKRGAQNPAYLMNPDAAAIERLIRVSHGLPKLISLAPELEGAMAFIRAVSGNIVVSIAHTDADYDIACEAFDAGATHVTHLCNAMRPLLHREPGVIGAAADKNADVEVICDGIHIHPAMIRAIFRLFGEEHVILISDSMEATGMQDGSYELGGQAVTVRGHLATLESGTIAGSATNLYDCMVNAIRFGIPEKTAIYAATRNPARSIGIDDLHGGIREGKAADLLVVDDAYTLEKVILAGKNVLTSPGK
jgi:N-acetylglucosamine-6-phosphate deacetylase